MHTKMVLDSARRSEKLERPQESQLIPYIMPEGSLHLYLRSSLGLEISEKHIDLSVVRVVALPRASQH